MSDTKREKAGETGRGTGGARRPRLRREDPQQGGPNRGWQGWFQSPPWGFGAGQSQSAEDPGDESPGGRPSSPMETVERGVKMAYKVVEDYIDQGRRVAQKVNTQQYGPRELGDDLQAVTERMMRDSTRFLSLWFELMGSAMGMGWGRSRSDRAQTATATGDTAEEGEDRRDLPGPPEPRTPSRARVAIEIGSHLPARVEVDLPPGAADRPLHVTPLHTVGADAPPIAGVTFEPGTPVKPAVVRIAIPAEQPSGHYHGTLADPESHKSRGTITVHLLAPAQPSTAKPSSAKPPSKRASAKKSPAKKFSAKSSSGKKSTGKKSSRSARGSKEPS